MKRWKKWKPKAGRARGIITQISRVDIVYTQEKMRRIMKGKCPYLVDYEFQIEEEVFAGMQVLYFDLTVPRPGEPIWVRYLSEKPAINRVG